MKQNKITSMLILAPLIVAFCSCGNNPGPLENKLLINEVCSKNRTSYVDSFGENPDWIELYNGTPNDIDLSGYSISNDIEDKKMFVFDNFSINKNSYLLLMASGRNVVTEAGEIHLPFDISQSKGGTIYLFDKNEALVDELTFAGLKDDITFGTLDNKRSMLYPSPGSKNIDKYVEHETLDAPVFSVESGMYDDEFDLTLTSNKDIFYTLDGSEPTRESLKYEAPIHVYDKSSEDNVLALRTDICATHKPFAPKNPISKCFVIKAKCFDFNGDYSKTATSSYWINQKSFLTDNIAVMSISTDFDNLFDFNKGIYCNGKVFEDYKNGPEFNPDLYYTHMPANYKQRGYDWEREGTMTFLNKKRNLKCEQKVGIRVHGSASSGEPKKGFGLYSRYNYDGNNNFTYKFNDIKCDNIILRAGGNYPIFPINDPLNTVIAQKAALNINTQENTPTFLYINGEFWGFYFICDSYDANFYEKKYDVVDPIVFKDGEVKDGYNTDIKYWQDFLSLRGLDFTKDNNYQKFCNQVDLESYIDFMIFSSYFHNTDYGVTHNFVCWRTRENGEGLSDGKIRFSLFDTDYCGGINSNPESNPFANANFNYKYPCLDKLLKRTDFQERFLTRAEELSQVFVSKKVKDAVKKNYDDYYEPMLLGNTRFYTGNCKSTVEGYWNKRQTFIENRNTYYLDFVKALIK